MALAVVDASAVSAVLFGEPEAEHVTGRLEERELVAPSLLPYEVANVAAFKLRRRLLPLREVATGLELFARLDIALRPADPAALTAVAERSGLTAYDAAYLWLADSLGAELVTLDRRLERAWRDAR
ncbi:MAG TPA: type II toxin-antitoxin system VapC family toxin [Anaeromyxobacteraceae bacterium]|nr:type II toxin-antitoxin system VapC family toxin [Anaeromyxobacteraceae bacterium]